MTIIIASQGGIVADSKCSAGDSSYRGKKIIRWKGELIGTAGSNRGIEKFLFWYRGKRNKPIEIVEGEEFDILVVSKRGVFSYCNCSFPDVILDEHGYAGNGSTAAKAAVMGGASPRRAVEIACAIVECCGLPVQEEKL